MTRLVTLRDERAGADRRCLWARLDDGSNLVVYGQDLGPGTAMMNDDGEFEVFMTISSVECLNFLSSWSALRAKTFSSFWRPSVSAHSHTSWKRLRESGIPIAFVSY